MQKGYKFALAKSFMVGKELSDAEFRLLVTMWNYSDEEGRKIFGSRKRLAEDCGWSTRTVDRHLKTLREKGWVHVDEKGHSYGRNGGGFANEYSLRIPDRPELIDNADDRFDGNQSTNGAELIDTSGKSPDNSGKSLDNPDVFDRQSYVAPTDPYSHPRVSNPPSSHPRGTDPRAAHLANEGDSSAREATTDDDKHQTATSPNEVAGFRDGTEEEGEQSPGRSPSPGTHFYSIEALEPDYDDLPDPAEYEWLYNILDRQEVSDEVPTGNYWECRSCGARVGENTPPRYTYCSVDGPWICANHDPSPALIPWTQRFTA